MVSRNFLENSTFIGSYPSFESLPEDAGSEIAFVEDLIAVNQVF